MRLHIIVAVVAALFAHASALLQFPLIDWSLFSTENPSEVFRVQVPNTVLGALVDANRYDFDPYYGKNLDLINETEFLVPWTFETTFTLPAGDFVAGSRALLQLNGINYYAVLHVNGVLVANATELVGAFRRFTFDMTSLLQPGWNGGVVANISITVTSESHTPRKWRSHNTALGFNFMDWNPHPKDGSMGVYRSVAVLILPPPTVAPPITIEGFVVKTTLPVALPDDSVIALLNASFVVRCWSPTPVSNVSVVVDFGLNGTDGGNPVIVTLPQMNLLPASNDGRSSEVRVYLSWETSPQMIIETPPLWWPWQMGEQPLQTATVYAESTSASEATVVFQTRYGLRDVRTELNQGGALQFRINHVPIMFRGGGWTSDLFSREKSRNRLVQEFELIRSMGLNGLRLEGMLESDLFYEVADAYGIMIIPGLPCCDGWQNWTSWPEQNYGIAQQSIQDQARRMASHPSVIGFFEASDSLPPPDVELMYLTTFVKESWPNALISSASQQVSNISGNPGVKMVGPYSWEPPTYWLADGNGLVNGNYGGAWGFFTEGGPGEAPMTFSSWNRTTPAAYLWNETTQSMDSWWSYHMGEPFGHFRNLTFYTPPLNARYGASKSAREYLFRAQAANYEGIRAFVEGYSRNKHNNATGFVQWMMNNAWPSHLWHLYDYYLVAGGGFYGAKMACQDLHVMMSPTDGSLWMINSRFRDFGAVTVVASVVSLNGTAVWMQMTTLPVVPSDASIMLEAVPSVPITGKPWFTELDTFFVRLQWSYMGGSSSDAVIEKENWYWLNAKPDVMDFPASNGFRTPCTSFTNFTQLNSLPVANFTTEIASITPQLVQLQLTASSSNPSVAFLVYLRFVNKTTGFDFAPQIWSDNFVTLTPGATRILEVKSLLDDVLDLSQLDLVIESYNDQVSVAP